MPSTIQGQIEAALFTRVASLVLTPSLPVAWPNRKFVPPASGFLRVTLVPNINRRLFIGSTDPHQRLGLLMLSVFSPLDQGQTNATELAGEIAAHFPTDLRMTSGSVTVRVQRAPEVAQGMVDGAYWHVPVTVRWRAIA